MAVGLSRDKSRPISKEVIDAEPRSTLADSLTPGPYGPQDVEQDFRGFSAGRGESAVKLSMTSSGKKDDKTFHLSDGTTDYGVYGSETDARRAAKEILSHAHGMDEKGGLIFKPKGAAATELGGSEKQRKDFYSRLADHVRDAKRVKPVEMTFPNRKEPAQVIPVTKNFGVEKVEGKKNQFHYNVVHLKSGLSVPSSWKHRDAALGHAVVVQNMPGVDWDTFLNQSPDVIASVAKRVGAAKEAYTNDELHEDLALPERLKESRERWLFDDADDIVEAAAVDKSHDDGAATLFEAATAPAPSIHVPTKPEPLTLTPAAPQETILEKSLALLADAIRVQAQHRPEINVTMPEQKPPVVNVKVEAQKPTKKVIHRDEDGNITEVEEVQEDGR